MLMFNKMSIHSLQYWLFTYLDVNECTTGLWPCSDNAQCTNTMGSFECECFSNYTGDGMQCTSGRQNNECHRDSKKDSKNVLKVFE